MSRKPPKERVQEVEATLNTETLYTPSTSSTVAVPAKDHSYATSDSPRSFKRKLDTVVDRAEELKVEQCKKFNVSGAVKSLSEIVPALRKNAMISSGCEKIPESTFTGVSQLLMKRIMNQKSARPTHSSYPDKLKSFALTLAFYSLKAYNYVRRTLHLALPHSSTLRQWYRGVNGEPGYTEETFKALCPCRCSSSTRYRNYMFPDV